MADALFGSKTRVKLLKLFLNNPDTSYYVREITRLIDEQINSVRRELSNMLKIGVITSDSRDNKLYYQLDKAYPHYIPLQAIFAEDEVVLLPASEKATSSETGDSSATTDPTTVEVVGLPPSIDPQAKYYNKLFEGLVGVHGVIIAGKLVRGSVSPIDVLIIGQLPNTKLKAIIKNIESKQGREVNYTVMPTEEFNYRVSVRDKFIGQIVDGKYKTVKDVGGLITGGSK